MIEIGRRLGVPGAGIELPEHDEAILTLERERERKRE